VSDTPRTDSLQGHRLVAHVPVLFARTLERELNAANAENALLRADLAKAEAERDEARRLYCHAQARIPDGREKQLAQTLGWDCFDAPHATDGRVQNGGA